jgi:chemotaxis protein methyltransferase CheR
MRDAETVAFLQWALPRLGMRWAGFRKVRGQVAKRLRRRLVDLGLPDLDAYRHRLEADDAEWRELDLRCRITISRFRRDRAVWDRLEQILRSLGEARAWCAGCASGEEPYTLAMTARDAGARVTIVATDADPHLLERARAARYPAGSLRELSEESVDRDFERVGDEFVLHPRLRDAVEWRCEDLREIVPDGPFDLILCRYLAFTYFDEDTQAAVMRRIRRRLTPGGLLVVGSHETPPDGSLEPLAPCLHRLPGSSESTSRPGRPAGPG